MPTNVTPQYQKAEDAYKAATTREEKIACLENMISLLPKHKGTDKLFADLKRRLAKLKTDSGGKAGKRSSGPKVEKEGAAQVVLLGYPNVGKSQIVDQLSNAEPQVADYPFTTRMPQPAMMEVDDVQVQLVDMPAITPDFLDTWVPDIVRGADAAVLVVDAGNDDLLEQFQGVIDRLASLKITLDGKLRRREVDAGMNVKLPTVLAANKIDLPDAADRIEILHGEGGFAFPRLELSAKDGAGLEEFRRGVWEHLNLIRVYTKPPGKPPDMSTPYTLPEGGTVDDLCHEVHRDFADNLKFARIWGHGAHAGQRISRDHVLHDGDLLELHV